jgi:TPR repeat protein
MSKIARLVSAGFILLIGVVPSAHAASLATARIAGRSEAASVTRTVALAQRGDPHAQAILGFMYANGRGVPQSYDVAVDWYVLSAEQGDPLGQYLLGLMYDKGFGVTPNVILAHKWLNLAAAHTPRQNRENVLRLRDAVASKMTRAQLDMAQQLAVDFAPVRY